MFFAIQRFGQDVKGGGHPADQKLTEQEDIDAGLDRQVPGHSKTPGIDDPGTPGSKTNPVSKEREPEPESNKPLREIV